MRKENKNNDLFNNSPRVNVLRHFGEYHDASMRFLLKVNNADYIDYVLGKRAHASWYSLKWSEDREKNCWINCVIFVFLAHKKYSHRFAKLKLSHWCHMDYFTDVLATFLDLGTFQLSCCLWRVRQLSDQNYHNLCPKMNEGLTGLERHMRVSNSWQNLNLWVN